MNIFHIFQMYILIRRKLAYQMAVLFNINQLVETKHW